MRKIITFVTALGFIATASLGLATMTKSSQEEFTVSGKTVAIEDGILSLREPNGEIFNVAAKRDKLEGIEVGDRVVAKVEGGWAVSIKKTGKKVESEPAKGDSESAPASPDK